jgi:hypothetical protein
MKASRATAIIGVLAVISSVAFAFFLFRRFALLGWLLSAAPPAGTWPALAAIAILLCFIAVLRFRMAERPRSSAALLLVLALLATLLFPPMLAAERTDGSLVGFTFLGYRWHRTPVVTSTGTFCPPGGTAGPASIHTSTPTICRSVLAAQAISIFAIFLALGFVRGRA